VDSIAYREHRRGAVINRDEFKLTSELKSCRSVALKQAAALHELQSNRAVDASHDRYNRRHATRTLKPSSFTKSRAAGEIPQSNVSIALQRRGAS